jgi:TrmH family RNA methyltransferase
VFYKNLPDFLSIYQDLEDFKIYGTFLEGDNIYSSALKSKGLIIMGSESHGISDELVDFIDQKLYIPPGTSDKKVRKSESLNISVATGIVCSEFRKNSV